MTVAINYDDVMDQMRGFGLIVDSIDLGRLRRCKVEGRRDRPGWYAVHEERINDPDHPNYGSFILIGQFGIWEGLEKNAQKIRIEKIKLSESDKQARRARYAEDRKKADARRAGEAKKASEIATRAWAQCSPEGECEYLKKKGVLAHGARFTKRGNLIIPMLDAAGQIHGLQVIYGNAEDKKRKGRDKDFWPIGLAKAGHYFMLGAPSALILIAEGYATAAAVHETTNLPVVVAFDAGNLRPVAEAIRKRYRTARILICADDDFATRGNPGLAAADQAALAVGGSWVAPVFETDPVRADIASAAIEFSSDDYKQHVERIRAGRKKLTDFNDLQQWALGGPHLVKAQIEAKLVELKWNAPESVREGEQTGGRGAALKPISSLSELFDRFAIIYGHNKSVFDFHERMLLSIEDMRNACTSREMHRAWMESADKKIVRIENVGFDPSGADPAITCNLWGGWPMQPQEGKCTLLLELLSYLCLNEQNHKDLYDWILKWLAYPLQHPGAKMKTALVVHGPQRVGKNFFFESVMQIYGQYGQVIDQDALEDKYNDCFSRKLFLIADEVIARQELYHVKNKLKGMITGRRIRINPKNVKSYWETNHCNLIFLSNETQPLVLERDDGRHVVLWTPKKLSMDFYKSVEREVDEGGIPALYHHLLNIDLGDFNEYTPPPMTVAKRDLMDLSMDSEERFWLDWTKEKIEHVPPVPTKTTLLYAFYREYTSRAGYARYAPETRFLAHVAKRTDAKKSIRRYQNGSGQKQATFIFPPGIEQPVDRAEPIWLGECIEEFTQGVTRWREEFEAR